jgi:flagellar hook-length control protein FliK
MSIDTRNLESGARVRLGSPSASPNTNGQSDVPFAQFLSAADTRPSPKPASIGARIEEKLATQRRNDDSAQARRQIERQRDASAEQGVIAKPAEKAADDGQSSTVASTTVSDPPDQPGTSTQRVSDNRQLTASAQGRGPHDSDQSDVPQADATHGKKSTPNTAQTPEGTHSTAAKARALQTVEAAPAALPDRAAAGLEAIEDPIEDGKASITRKGRPANQTPSEAAATTVAQPIPDAVMTATAQMVTPPGSDKAPTGKLANKAVIPAIDTTTDTGGPVQRTATGAPASVDAGTVSGGGGGRQGAGPGSNASAGHDRHALPGRAAAGAAGTGLPQALRDAQSVSAGNASPAEASARLLTDNAVMNLAARQQTDSQQGSTLARLTDQGVVSPASFAALLRSADASGETRNEALSQPPSFPITVPFDDPRFGGALSERVQWLVKEGIQSAELTLHPQDMGPIRIEMSIDGMAASIDFAATQADTRAAIEQALPRLRDLLADQGLQLGGTQIGADTRRQDNPGHRARPSGGETRTATVDIPDATSDGVPVSAMPAPRRNAAGRIDLFA